MRNISLLAIEMEGFRSFRTKTLVEFSQGAGLKFIGGDNKVAPRLGANGAGKSTVWDALIYCLTGRSVKGLRASDLLSWGAKQIHVLTAWEIDDKVMVVERFGMPDRIVLNDQPIDQAALDRLLGLSRARQLQSVIFGQATPLFIDLTGPERGVILDEVLDTGLWLKAADKASQRHTEASKAMDAAARDIAYLTGKLEGAESPESLLETIASWQATQDKKIEAAIAAVEVAETDLEKLKPAIRKARKALEALPDDTDVKEQLRLNREAHSQKKIESNGYFMEQLGINNRLEFYKHSRVCDTCMQTIDEKFVESQLKQLNEKARLLELSAKGCLAQQVVIADVLDRLEKEQDALAEQRSNLVSKLFHANEAFRLQKREVEFLTRNVETLGSEANPYQARYDALIETREKEQQALRAATAIKRRLQASLMRADFWRAAFKRVRLFMVKRVLQQLEIETAAAASILGLIGWTISFSTELETKSGSIRPGIHIQVASPTASAPWEAYSGGEGQRIRLAVALGLASLIQRMAGVVYNFEVWDEPTAFLGNEGIEDLLACLTHRAEALKKSLWLCDHRALSHSGFAEIWSVTKTADGSSMKMLSNQES